jgi:hypothetical protein
VTLVADKLDLIAGALARSANDRERLLLLRFMLTKSEREYRDSPDYQTAMAWIRERMQEIEKR